MCSGLSKTEKRRSSSMADILRIFQPQISIVPRQSLLSQAGGGKGGGN